jgi:hypothetical protein
MGVVLRSIVTETTRRIDAEKGVYMRLNALRGAPRLVAALAVGTTIAGGALALSAVPASAAALTNVNFAASNTAVSSTLASNTSIYAVSFTPATSALVNTITFSVPTGTPAATLTVGSTFGLGACGTITAALAGTTVTVSMTTACTLSAAGSIYVQISGFTNTSTAIASFASAVATKNGGTAVDAGTASSVNFVSNTTPVTIIVPDSLTFTNSSSSITLFPIPGASPITAPPYTLGITTNAHSGYILNGCSAGITGTTTSVLFPQASAGTALSGTVSGFGVQVAATGTGATVASPFAGLTGNFYQGFATTCSGTNHQIASNAGATAGDSYTFTAGASASGTQPADVYTGTINYQVVPNYS